MVLLPKGVIPLSHKEHCRMEEVVTGLVLDWAHHEVTCLVPVDLSVRDRFQIALARVKEVNDDGLSGR